MRNLRSNLGPNEVKEVAEAYKRIKVFDEKNVYLDRLVQVAKATDLPIETVIALAKP